MLDVFGTDRSEIPDDHSPSAMAINIYALFIDNGVDISTPIDQRAKIIAHFAHAGQIRLSDGSPYSSHTDYVANGKGFSVLQRALGHLHDTLEKTPLKEIDLIWLAMPPAVIDKIRILTTKDSFNPYFDDIERINQDNDCRVVKMRDIKHNSSDREQVTAALRRQGKLASLEIRNENWDIKYPLALAYMRATDVGIITPDTNILEFMLSEECPENLRRADWLKNRHLSSHVIL